MTEHVTEATYLITQNETYHQLRVAMLSACIMYSTYKTWKH